MSANTPSRTAGASVLPDWPKAKSPPNTRTKTAARRPSKRHPPSADFAQSLPRICDNFERPQTRHTMYILGDRGTLSYMSQKIFPNRLLTRSISLEFASTSTMFPHQAKTTQIFIDGQSRRPQGISRSMSFGTKSGDTQVAEGAQVAGVTTGQTTRSGRQLKLTNKAAEVQKA